MRERSLTSLPTAALVLACLVLPALAAASLEGDASQPDCGLPVVEAPVDPVEDACIDGQTVAGPVVYAGSDAAAGAELAFSVPADGTVCVHVANGASRVTAGSIGLDGEELFGPRDFLSVVGVLQARRPAGAGEHAVSIELAPQRDRSLSVEVRYVADDLSPRHSVDGKRVRLFDSQALPEIFSPNGNGIRDTTDLRVIAQFLRPTVANAGWPEHRFETSFEIADGMTCAPVRTLVASAPATEPTAEALAATWDGTDGAGAVVADGTYFYRAIVRAFQIGPKGKTKLLDEVQSQIQAVRVTSDDEPPLLEITNPSELHGSTFAQLFEVMGTAFDEGSGIELVVVEDAGVEMDLPLAGDPDLQVEFDYDLTLSAPGAGALYRARRILITAVDRAANETSEEVRVDRLAEFVGGQLVIIAAPGTPPSDVAITVQAAGGAVKRYLRGPNAYVVSFYSEADAAAAIPLLTDSGDFQSVERDAIQQGDRTPRDGLFSGPGSLNQEALDVIHARDAWDITTGSRKVTIGVLDTGIDHRHLDLENNLFVNPGEIPVGPSFPVQRRLVDTNGDGVITFGDLNHPDNLGKVPGTSTEVHSVDLIDGDPNTDIGLEGDLNGDSCPGVCNVDDDLDGFADLEDRDVQAADYDGDGVMLWGPDMMFGTGDDDQDDVALASKDDDENGVADDILGADFGCDAGESVEDDEGDVSCPVFTVDNDPFDLHGHGTAVAGIIGATEDDLARSVVGVNWEVRLVAARMSTGDSKSAAGSASMAAADYMAQLAKRPENQLKVVNYSFGALLGSPDDPRPPRNSDARADVLDDVGVLLVASAGNAGVDLDGELDENGNPVRSNDPSSDGNPNIISVAASKDDGDLAGFSNRGTTQVDLSAPGHNGTGDPSVLTTYPLDDCLGWTFVNISSITHQCVKGYAMFNGTSAAAPYVSGVLGLMQSVNPSLPHISLRSLLLGSVDTSDDLNVATRGLLDAEEAVDAALAAPVPIPEGVAADQDPTISADGRVIAFVSNRVSASNPFALPRIWLVAPDGTGLTEVEAPPGALEVEPSLNGDGTKLAFASTRDGGNFEIWVVDIDLMDFSVTRSLQRTFNTVDDLYPAISEDGRFVAFASTFDGDGDTFGDFEVFRVPAVSGAVTQITDDKTPEPYFVPEFLDDRRPSISPDGQIVTWVRFFNQGPPGHGQDAIGVARFGAGGQVTSLDFINPVNTDKTAVTLAGPGPRVFFGRTVISGPSNPDLEFWSVALDGNDLQSIAAGNIGGGVSPGGEFIANYGIGGFGASGLTRREFATNTALQIAKPPLPFQAGARPDDVLHSCDLGNSIAISGAIDHRDPVCDVALSGDGRTVVFVGTFRALFEDAPAGQMPKDIFVFREGVGTQRVTPF